MTSALRGYSTYGRGTTIATELPGEQHIHVLNDWARLRRFLILGSERMKYSVASESSNSLTKENAEALQRCLKENGRRVVDEIVAVSHEGLAVKNDPALFALALAASLGDTPTRTYAMRNLAKVARTGTHLLHFYAYARANRGGGNALRNGVRRWFNEMPASKLAYQMVKYRSRDDWAMRDILRLSKPSPASPDHDAIFQWAVGKWTADTAALYSASDAVFSPALNILYGWEKLNREKDLSAKKVAALVQEYHLPREAIPTEYLRYPDVWAALLPDMPLTALIRNLATMTRNGLLQPFSAELRHVIAQLGNEQYLQNSRIHPLTVLSALYTYQAGQSQRGDAAWTPLPQITGALDNAFYACFKNVIPSGKNILLALDVSDSMRTQSVVGLPGLTARDVTAAMAVVTMATEPSVHIIAFSGPYAGYWRNSHSMATAGVMPIDIAPHMRLDDVVRRMQGMPFANTNISLPMSWAQRKGLKNIDGFVVYTDNETNYGPPPQTTLRSYRQACNADARLIVAAVSATDFTVADQSDPLSMDVAGFDSSAPAIISDFVAGRL